MYYTHRPSECTSVGKLRLRKVYYVFSEYPNTPIIGWTDEHNVVQFYSYDPKATPTEAIFIRGAAPKGNSVRSISEFIPAKNQRTY